MMPRRDVIHSEGYAALVPVAIRAELWVYVPEHPLRMMTLARFAYEAKTFPETRDMRFVIIAQSTLR